MNAILGKRQIVIAALVVALGLAVYLNWQFSVAGDDLTATGALTSSKQYGDAAFVNTSGDATVSGSGSESLPSDASTTQTNAQASQYFVEARLNRERTRDEALDTIKDVLNNVDADAATQTQAMAQSAQIASNIETEGKIENLIKAKGFADCMVYLDGEKATVVVQSPELVASEVMQIKDIITANSDVKGDGINIVPVQ